MNTLKSGNLFVIFQAHAFDGKATSKEGRKCVSDLIRRREDVRDCDCPVLIPQERKREEEVPRAPNLPPNNRSSEIKTNKGVCDGIIVIVGDCFIDIDDLP